jgi:iron(III) transport system substrate-binding protein
MKDFINSNSPCRTKFFAILGLIVFSTLSLGLEAQEKKDSTLTVYTSQKEHIIKPLFEAFTEETGIDVQYTYSKAGPLIQRLKAEGKSSEADVFMTIDAGNLWLAAKNNLLKPMDSEVLEKRVPSHLRDPKNRWFGYSIRARTIVYSTERVDSKNLSSYEDLADPKWKGKLCLRTSQHVYNQSLVAILLRLHGQEKTEKIVKGWVDNLATKPFGSDTQLLKAIKSGQCDVGITNHYYLARLKAKNKDFPASVKWPNQDSSGVHVNIFGAGLSASVKNEEAARKMLKWLAGEDAQTMISQANYEFPVVEDVEPNKIVKKWGDFKQNTINVSEAGQLQAAAVMLMDRVGYR